VHCVASLLIAAVLIEFCFGCGPKLPQETMTSGHARIGASDAVFDLAWFLSREFQGGNPAAFIDIRRAPARELVDSLLKNRSQEVFLDRTLTPPETLALTRAGFKIYSYPVAYYPVYLAVAEANTVHSIDSTELRGVLLGTVSNWSQLGGTDMPLTLYLPLPGEGAWQSVMNYFGRLDSVAAVICSTSAAMLDSAKGDEGALLVWSKPLGDLPYRALTFRWGGEEVRPTVKTILEEPRYPFHLDITYVTTRNKTDVAARYLTFAVSNLGQRRLMDALRYRPASVPVRVIQMKQ